MSGLDQHAIRSVQDWRFFFHEAAAKMGIKAIDYERKQVIFSGMICSGGPDFYQLAAARRHAKIEQALQRMKGQEVALIRMTCEVHARERWRPFGEHGLGNIADRTEAARRWHKASRSTRSVEACLDRLGFRLQNGKATAEDRGAREKIREDVEDVICELHASYEKARKGIGR